MKKCVLFSFSLLFSVCLLAQSNIAAGPVAGFGHSWISNVDGKTRYKPSGNFGAQLYYSATPNVGIGAALLYSIEGGENRISGSTYTARLNYLRLPIQAIYFFGQYGDRVRPKIAFGPSVGFMVGGKQMLNTSETGVSDDYKSIDFGFQANAGIHYRLVSGVWLTMDMGYYQGLTDVSEAVLKNRNRNLGFNLGLAFGVGRR